MSFYNMIYGVQLATFFVLPMLGKHPDEYPRFRDCFIGKAYRDWNDKDEFGIPKIKHGKGKFISVFTRVGGNNRMDYQEEINELRKNSYYVEDFDDEFDNTFAFFVFKVPKEFEEDFDKIKEGRLIEISDEYKKRIYKVYPKLKDKLDAIFASQKSD